MAAVADTIIDKRKTAGDFTGKNINYELKVLPAATPE
jgi:hypothetical protein